LVSAFGRQMREKKKRFDAPKTLTKAAAARDVAAIAASESRSSALFGSV
jgi:hypothetical protein